jgi:hypothetical protein
MYSARSDGGVFSKETSTQEQGCRCGERLRVKTGGGENITVQSHTLVGFLLLLKLIVVQNNWQTIHHRVVSPSV